VSVGFIKISNNLRTWTGRWWWLQITRRRPKCWKSTETNCNFHKDLQPREL